MLILSFHIFWISFVLSLEETRVTFHRPFTYKGAQQAKRGSFWKPPANFCWPLQQLTSASLVVFGQIGPHADGKPTGSQQARDSPPGKLIVYLIWATQHFTSAAGARSGQKWPQAGLDEPGVDVGRSVEAIEDVGVFLRKHLARPTSNTAQKPSRIQFKAITHWYQFRAIFWFQSGLKLS
jgi:hypothetical protein